MQQDNSVTAIAIDLNIGTIVNSQGKCYIGEVVKGRKSGIGKVEFQGKSYLGGFIESQRHGVGIVHDVTGEIKKGFFVDGLLEGFGQYEVRDKNYSYKGTFRKGIPSGKGQESTFNSRYFGDFLKGARDGTGIFVLNTGEEYIGQWEAGHRHGIGLEHSEFGDTYLGDFCKGKKEGIGCVTYKS